MTRSHYPSDTKDRILVRMPQGVMPALKRLAESERRSVNQQIVFLIEQAIISQVARTSFTDRASKDLVAIAATGEGLGNHAPAAASDSTALAGGSINPR